MSQTTLKRPTMTRRLRELEEILKKLDINDARLYPRGRSQKYTLVIFYDSHEACFSFAQSAKVACESDPVLRELFPGPARIKYFSDLIEKPGLQAWVTSFNQRPPSHGLEVVDLLLLPTNWRECTVIDVLEGLYITDHARLIREMLNATSVLVFQKDP